MKEELLDLIKEKSPNAIPLYLVIRGSHAYATNIETSDFDYSGIFCQDLDSILGNKYIEQINDDNNDIVIYELRRFLELLEKNNPTILELLNTPEDCVLYKHPSFDDILAKKDSFITKQCSNSFGGYAVQQIKKAKGMNKKQNWESEKKVRKTPLDFCYLHIKENSIPLKKYFKENNIDQENCGLSNVPHSKFTYALFYDKDNKYKFKGLAFEKSNEVRLSSIPMDIPDNNFIGHISYNKDGYMQHCKDYKSYKQWLEERNTARWVDVKSHNQKIDGKNMMHCRRLISMAKEIASDKEINVRREDASELLDIRKGRVDLNELIEITEKDIKVVDKLFEESDLPEKVESGLINNMLISMRKDIYGLS